MSRVRQEIAEQPEVVARLLAGQRAAIRSIADIVVAQRPAYAVIAARGSSDYVALYAQHLLGVFCSLPVALATPSLHTLYDAPVRYESCVVIGISQSGASPDVASVLQAASEQDATTIAITNEPDSRLADAARHVIELGGGPETALAATKTYTASLAAAAALAVAMAGRGWEDLAAIPAAMERQLAADDGIEDLLGDVVNQRRLVTLGRGPNRATAFEAAIKLTELSGIPALAYSPADFLHGPIAMIDAGFPLVGVCTPGPARGSVVEVLEAAQVRGGRPFAIGTTAGSIPCIDVVEVPEWLSPLVAVLPMQQLAVSAGERLGIDVDRPFGLTKITQTT